MSKNYYKTRTDWSGLTYNRVKSISKELKQDIMQRQSSCTTKQEKNEALHDARHFINEKYGYDWRHKPD